MLDPKLEAIAEEFPSVHGRQIIRETAKVLAEIAEAEARKWSETPGQPACVTVARNIRRAAGLEE